MADDNQMKKRIKKEFDSPTAWRNPENESCFWLSHEKKQVVGLFPKSADRVLDLGTGRGRLTAEIGRICRKQVAFDLSMNMLKTVNHKNENADIFYVQGDCDKLPFKSESFDFINAIEVVGHSSDLNVSCREIGRTLKKGGFLVLSTGNSLSCFHLFTSRMICMNRHLRNKGVGSLLLNLPDFFSSKRKFWIMEQGHCRNSYFRLKSELERAGLKITKVSGAGFIRLRLLRFVEGISTIFPFKYFSSLLILACQKK